MGEQPQPDLGWIVRREAERHVPDRDAMLARIAQRRTEPVRSRWSFLALRPVAAAASVVATLVVGFTGIRLLADRPEDRPPAATGGTAVATSSAPAPSITTERPPAAPRTASPRTPATNQATRAGEAPAPEWTPTAGYLSSAAVVDPHSNKTWTQGNLTLATTETITELDVVVRVARSEGVKDAGRWSSVPAEMMTLTVTEKKDALLYRFTLNEGRTLAPGSYVFAAQYLHGPGERDPGGDTYGAIAVAGANRAEVTGAFTRS